MRGWWDAHKIEDPQSVDKQCSEVIRNRRHNYHSLDTIRYWEPWTIFWAFGVFLFFFCFVTHYLVSEFVSVILNFGKNACACKVLSRQHHKHHIHHANNNQIIKSYATAFSINDNVKIIVCAFRFPFHVFWWPKYDRDFTFGFWLKLVYILSDGGCVVRA